MPYRSDPYANLGSTFNDLTRNLLTLRGQSMQQALSEAELQMRGNQFQETQRHNLALEEAARAQTAKDPNIVPMNRVDVLRTKIGMKSSLGLDDKDLNDIYEPILGMSGAPRGQVYDTLKAQGPDMRNLLLQRVSDVYEKKLSDPKTGMTYAQSPQAKAMEEFISHLDGDADLGKTIDSLFPDVARHRKTQEENSKAALLANKMDAIKEIVDIKIQAAKDLAEEKEKIRKGDRDKKDETLKENLRSIREDKKYLQRQINTLSGLPNVAAYADQKAMLPQYQQELADLQAQENELLGRKPKKAATGGNANMGAAVNYLKGAKNRVDAISYIQELAKKGWSKDDLRKIASQAGWE